MAKAYIHVDLLNPGQVFACLGFMEAAELLLGGAACAFDWQQASTPIFRLHTAGPENPFAVCLEFISGAEVSFLIPHGSNVDADKPWKRKKIRTEILAADAPYPFPGPDEPAKLVAQLSRTGTISTIAIEHWGEESRRTGRDAVKFWAGSGGYPGAALVRDLLQGIKQPSADMVADPFAYPAPQSSSFRFDWRGDYIPLEIGFSLNKHTGMEAVGYPLVELFAAIGLSHARPRCLNHLDYRYGILGTADSTLFRPALIRAALGGSALPFSLRTFRMQLGWPGQEGQARSITTVYEET